MPNIDVIRSAVYAELAGDETLSALCTAYKGKRRPAGFTNPTITVEIANLEGAEGKGVWMCDVFVTAYVDILSNSVADHVRHAALDAAIRLKLAGNSIDIDGVKVMPLWEGEIIGPEWDADHDTETYLERRFGMIFITFD